MKAKGLSIEHLHKSAERVRKWMETRELHFCCALKSAQVNEGAVFVGFVGEKEFVNH